MGNVLRSAAIFGIGVAVGSLTIPALSAQFRSANVTRLITTDLTGFCDGKEVIVELNEYGPGTNGKHYHPGHSFGYVTEGSQTITVEGQAAKTFRAGDVSHEEPNQVHTSENSATVKLFLLRILEKGKPETVRVP
jgi:oxalate decarboxylase/phosphoglucose isomerase-like protein (cupin superfamily)